MSIRPALIVGIFLASAFAGCADNERPPVDRIGEELLVEPWRLNWSTLGTSFDFVLDPDAQILRGVGTITVRNDVGIDLPYLLLYLEPVTTEYVRDEQGEDLVFDDGTVAAPAPV